MREKRLKKPSRAVYTANRLAFAEVFGDPFAKPEPTTGHYQVLKSRGPVAAMNNNFDEGKATRNPASPNIIDFFCDVERVLETTLTNEQRAAFEEIYIYEDGDGGLTQDERTGIEQRLGQAFRDKGITPVSKYFTSIRGKTGSDRNSRSNERNNRDSQTRGIRS